MTTVNKSIPFQNAKAGFIAIQNYLVSLGYKKGSVDFKHAFSVELAFRRKFQSYL